MMDFKSLNLPSMKQLVVKELEDKILTGKIPCGTKLPSEAELSKSLCVGRRTVREALHVLQTRGLVEILQGKGTYVIRNDLDNYLFSLSSNISNYLLIHKGKIENVLEIREIFETYALKVAIERENTALIEKLKENIKKQKTALSRNDATFYHQSHLEFHFLLIQNLNNPIIQMVYEQVMKLIEDIVLFYAGVQKQMERSISEHEDILMSLERGNLSQGIQKMYCHLANAHENFKKRQMQSEVAL